MKKIRQNMQIKNLSVIILIVILFASIIGIVSFESFTEGLLTQYADDAFLTARTAALELNADDMQLYEESEGKTPEYLRIWSRLDELCNAEGATFVYVIEPDLSDYKHITFLFSTLNEAKKDEYKQYDFGYVRETTNEDYRTKYRALYEEGSEQELVIRDKGYIETDPHITAMIPLKDSKGETRGILCVQRQMEILTKTRNIYLKRLFLTVFIILILTALGQGFYLNRKLLTPIKNITLEARRFAKENVLPEKKLAETVRARDEIGVLAASIDYMEEKIRAHEENLTRITAEKERIGAELELAARIQEDILPNHFPAFPERTEFDLYASMVPARAVGGDFYDFFLVDEDHLALVIADVSGKGVPAALFMMASKILLLNVAMLGNSPGEILRIVNNNISLNNQVEMFVTVWFGILEISTGIITAANAGHEYPIIRKPQGQFEILKDRHGFVVGGMPGISYKEYQIRMEPGMMLFLYTDGIPEASDRNKKMFGTERMVETLNTKNPGAPRETLDAMTEAVSVFVGDTEQFDDMTMLCLEYLGSGQER